MRIIKKLFRHKKAVPVDNNEKVIVLVGVVDSLDNSEEVYSLLCHHMRNKDSQWFITYLEVLTQEKAKSKKIDIPEADNLPYFLVITNPYDNTLDYTKTLYQTNNTEDLHEFLNQTKVK